MISNSFNFSWVFKEFLNKYSYDLDAVSKNGTIISVDDVTNKILLRDSNYIVDVVTWPKFGKHFYGRSYHNLSFIRIWPEKPIFLSSDLSSSSIIWDWH